MARAASGKHWWRLKSLPIINRLLNAESTRICHNYSHQASQRSGLHLDRVECALDAGPGVEDITAVLEGPGANRRRDETIRPIFPDDGGADKSLRNGRRRQKIDDRAALEVIAGQVPLRRRGMATDEALA